MQCIKCLKKFDKTDKNITNLPDMLLHFKKWTICSSCLEDNISDYRLRSQYYKDIQAKYRKNLDKQYINRLLADNSHLLPNDIPEELTKAKRQYLKTKRLTKEGK